MKDLTKNQVIEIADRHDYQLVHLDGGLIEICKHDWSEGFRATEVVDGKFSAWVYFGESANQANHLAAWNDLTDPPIVDDPLTPELVKSLIGKLVNVYYTGNNGHRYTMTIKPLEVGSKSSNQIGQKTESTMKFNLIQDCFNENPNQEEVKDFMYEWQGTFRVTGSAHKVLISK